MRFIFALLIILISNRSLAATPAYEEFPMEFPSAEEIARETIVYRAHGEAVAFVNAANLAQLRGLRACFCQTSHCGGATTVAQQGFEKTFISYLGKKETEQVSCAKIVPEFLQKVSLASADARLGLALGYATEGRYIRKIKSPLSTGVDLAPLTGSEESIAASKLIELKESKDEKIFRKKYIDLYFQMVKEANIVLYLESDVVTAPSIITALDRMIENAEARIDVKVNRPIDFVNSKWALPYTEALLRKDFPDDDFSKEIESIRSQGSSAQLFVAAGEVIGLIGSVLMCRIVPLEKPLVFLARVAARKGCQIALSAGAAFYFVAQSSYQQKQLLKFYMSSLDSSKTRVTRGQLLSAQAQVYLAVLTLPFAAL